MKKLPATFRWAMEVDIAPLRAAIRTASLYPLRAGGSGGSLTAAHAIAYFHQAEAHRLAAVATPLELVSESVDTRLGQIDSCRLRKIPRSTSLVPVSTMKGPKTKKVPYLSTTVWYEE
jgi:hypothetical protein